MRYLVITLALARCAAPPPPAPAPIDVNLQPYVDEFKSEFGVDFDNIIVQFTQDMTQYINLPGIIGVCEYNADDNTVYILQSWFQDVHTSEARKQALVSHELGHCYFNHGHDQVLLSDGCAESYMNHYSQSDGCLAAHWYNMLQTYQFYDPQGVKEIRRSQNGKMVIP